MVSGGDMKINKIISYAYGSNFIYEIIVWTDEKHRVLGYEYVREKCLSTTTPSERFKAGVGGTNRLN